MRRQLGFDLWYIFLGLFIICIIESTQIQDVNNYVLPPCVYVADGSGLIFLTSCLRLLVDMDVLDYPSYSTSLANLMIGISQCQRVIFVTIPHIE